MQDTNTHTEIEAILDEMIASGGSLRVQSRAVGGSTYWFKDYSVKDSTIYQTGHRLLSFLLPLPFFKAAPSFSPEIAMQLEADKIEAMRAAGISTPLIAAKRKTILVLKDAGTTLEDELRQIRKRQEGVGHDAKLVAWSGQVGKVHASGFTLGRPHPRDTILRDGAWTFLDFEEHPEKVMPFRTAQARDLLLLVLVLSKKLLDPSRLGEAMSAYQASAPHEILAELKRIMGAMKPVFFLAGIIMKIRAGKDLERFVLATDFLKENLEIT